MTSSINPNNIDGAYPVAGQDNNSQGFRDNFTNTKTNFAYASAEITDLQNKAVLKAALTGGTLNNDMNGVVLSNAQMQDISGTVVALGTVSGSFTVSYSAGPYQTITTAAPVSLAFSNFTAAGTVDYVVLQITVSNVAHTLQLPAAVGFSDSATSEIGIQGLNTGTNTITFSATGTYLYSFSTADGGTTVYINDLTQSRNSFSGNVSIGNIAVTGTTQAANVSTGALTVAGGVGIAGNLYVGGNIVGNIEIENISSIIGNVTAGNLLTGGLVSATGNVTGGNIRTVGLISATGNVTTAGALNTANISLTGNVLTALNVTGNIAGGNITTVGTISTSGAVSRALDLETVGYANITATASYTLSATSSINVLIANNTGYTATLNMPSTPAEGQICNFAVHGNTVTLAVGTGNVLPTFAGSTTVGTGYVYVYRVSDTSWYRIG